jgi:hypothetical protein
MLRINYFSIRKSVGAAVGEVRIPHEQTEEGLLAGGRAQQALQELCGRE